MTAGKVYQLMQSSSCEGAPFNQACVVDVVADRWGNVIASFSADEGKASGAALASTWRPPGPAPTTACG